MWAETPGDHPDGICLDSDGAVWYADVGNRHCVRVGEDGEVLDTVECDRGCLACALGGADGRPLFIVAQVWGGPESMRRLPEAARCWSSAPLHRAPAGRERKAMMLGERGPEPS